MNKAVSGFTLIELVVVITILGILAAFAYPHFASLDVEARKDAVNALAGSVRSAADQAHSMWLFQDNSATITMNGQTITMLNGYPNEASIDDALQDFSGFTFLDAQVAKFTKIGAPAGPNTCQVTYDNAAVGAPPEIIVDTTGC